MNHDELCINNDEFCIKHDGLWITNDEFCIENDEFSLSFSVYIRTTRRFYRCCRTCTQVTTQFMIFDRKFINLNENITCTQHVCNIRPHYGRCSVRCRPAARHPRGPSRRRSSRSTRRRRSRRRNRSRYVLDAACFVYTCRRLIDLFLFSDCSAASSPVSVSGKRNLHSKS